MPIWYLVWVALLVCHGNLFSYSLAIKAGLCRVVLHHMHYKPLSFSYSFLYCLCVHHTIRCNLMHMITHLISILCHRILGSFTLDLGALGDYRAITSPAPSPIECPSENGNRAINSFFVYLQLISFLQNYSTRMCIDSVLLEERTCCYE
ncbi:unnamed protein product [Amoebophrya sp. A120]|nr:unnamed protein product [Amoebophrya sp. A120]|eukprot:GSA120T00000898001.1